MDYVGPLARSLFGVQPRYAHHTTCGCLYVCLDHKSIGEKLENTLSLDYSKDKLEIIVASDGSTDKTN